MRKNVIADGMRNDVPRTPRDFKAPVLYSGKDRISELPRDSAIVAETLRQLKPNNDGTLDSINARHQWRASVGAFVQTYETQREFGKHFKTFDQKRFREAAGWYEPETGGNLS